MTVEIARLILTSLAVLVPIYIYLRRLQTNHLEGIKKDIRQIRQDIQGLETGLRSEIAGVRSVIDEHKDWHLNHPNPGGGVGKT